MGDGYYGNALRVAMDIPILDEGDRAVLQRFAAGAQHGADHVCLQDIARRVYFSEPVPECVNMTKQEMLSRIKILSDEIDANEDENRFMRKEIDDLYAKIDAGEFVPE